MHFETDILEKFNSQWALVTAGTPGHFNTMTISWGSLGTLWSKPVATVYIRPTRHTYSFLEKSEYFTVSFFPPEFRKDLGLLGTLSGRDCDKLSQTSLHAVDIDGCVGFAEASQTILCRKLLSQPLCREAIPDDIWNEHYGEGEEPHTMYIGEIIKIL